MTRDERVWFNLEPLTTGGISDHYINYGAEYNKDTIKDLEYIECHEVANLLKRMNRFFLWGRPSKNIDRRNRQIMRIGDKHPDLLDEIDAKYWKLNDGLEKTLMEHINRTGIGLIK
ncbi:DMP19 family protein [Aquimarina aggregata]|uniref:DMP19 family protein n=1 Tax=Aquimarina aggregata TaxID=1642818 RepID=UPI0012FDD5B5|nr:DUF4375 domain-containing protein [Aquimarina aggregata]